jgi:Superinfection immunity protein
MEYVIMEFVGVYFLPTIIATCGSHHQRRPIIIINLFLGWTLFGWVGAFAWSASAVRGQQIEGAWLTTPLPAQSELARSAD